MSLYIILHISEVQPYIFTTVMPIKINILWEAIHTPPEPQFLAMPSESYGLAAPLVPAGEQCQQNS